MGLVIIFGLAAILGIFALISAFKNKNFLGVLFALGSSIWLVFRDDRTK